MNTTARPRLKLVAAVTALVGTLLASQVVTAPAAHAVCVVVNVDVERVICIDPP